MRMTDQYKKPSAFQHASSMTTKLFEEIPVSILGALLNVIAVIGFCLAMYTWIITWKQLQGSDGDAAFTFVLFQLALLVYYVIAAIIVINTGTYISKVYKEHFKFGLIISELCRMVARITFALCALLAPVFAIAIWSGGRPPYFLREVVYHFGGDAKFLIGFSTMISMILVGFFSLIVLNFIADLVFVIFHIGTEISEIRNSIDANQKPSTPPRVQEHQESKLFPGNSDPNAGGDRQGF